METKKLEKLDVFDYMGIGYREDSYTEVLKHILINSEKSRQSFFEKLLEKEFDQSLDDIKIKTRNKYVAENCCKRKHITPDMIIASEKGDLLIVIEVKILSGEGDNQLNDYKDNLSNIAKKELPNNKKPKQVLYYLTLERQNIEGVTSITWSDVGKCICVNDIENEHLKMIAQALKDRCSSIEARYDDYDSCTWKDVVRTYKFIFAHKIMSDILKQRFKDEYEYESWQAFDKNNRWFSNSVKMSKPNWKSSQSVDNNDYKSLTVSNCYDFHYEIQYSEGNNIIVLRLDYHLNPYMSKSEIDKYNNPQNIHLKKMYDKLIELNENRKEAFKNLKKCYNLGDKKIKYNGLNDNIMILCKMEIDLNEENKTIDEVIRDIESFIENTKDIPNELLKQSHCIYM